MPVLPWLSTAVALVWQWLLSTSALERMVLPPDAEQVQVRASTAARKDARKIETVVRHVDILVFYVVDTRRTTRPCLCSRPRGT